MSVATYISLCWNIICICNLNCKFCFRNRMKKTNSVAANRRIIENLYGCGIRKITFSGGECLLYPHIKELLKMAHDLGICTSVITNGKILTPQMLKELEECVDFIVFSIDSVDRDINEEIGRGRYQADHVLELIRYVVNEQINLKIKINTVVSRKNLDKIADIGLAIKEYPIDRWKLMQFTSLRGDSISNQLEYSITEEEFRKATCGIEAGCKINKVNEKSIEDDYLLVDSEGNLFKTKNSEDVVICNCLDRNELTKCLSRQI